MKPRNIRTIFLKELKDTLRDRRTIIAMIVVPILLFPVLIIGMFTLIGAQMQRSQAKQHQVAIFGSQHYPTLRQDLTDTDKFTVLPIQAPEELFPGLLESKDPPEGFGEWVRDLIKEEKYRAVILIPSTIREKLDASEQGKVYLYFDEADFQSQTAEEKLRGVLRDINEELRKERLENLNLSEDFITPLKIEKKSVATTEERGAFLIGSFLPYIIVILTLTGSMYPAIDLTAGEKERGTLETLLVSPATRLELVLGKFFVVLAAGLITALLAVGSMAISFILAIRKAGSLAAGADAPPEIAFSVSLGTAALMLLMLVPLACLFAAVLMTVAVFAKSYKEAQSYVNPLMFVVILPAMMSFVPGFELNYRTAMIPIVNVCFLFKEVLLGSFQWGHIATTFVSTAVVAGIAIVIAMKQFQREEVLFRT